MYYLHIKRLQTDDLLWESCHKFSHSFGFGPGPERPHGKQHHIAGWVCVGNTSTCAPTSSIFIVSPQFSCCPQLIFHYFLFLFLSASLSFWFARSTFFSPSVLPSPPLLSSSPSFSIHPTQSHPSSLGRRMCCFDSKGSDEWEEGKQRPRDG